jgi:hypothetical protein
MTKRKSHGESAQFEERSVLPEDDAVPYEDPADAARREFTVTCQDGRTVGVVLTRDGAGAMPTAGQFQLWFSRHGDPLPWLDAGDPYPEGKCRCKGCCPCRYAPKKSAGA